jgi:hypothetical protein
MALAVESDLLARRALRLRLHGLAKQAEARRWLLGEARRAGRRRQNRRIGRAAKESLAGDRSGAAEALGAAGRRRCGIEAEAAKQLGQRVLGAARAPRFALSGSVGRGSFGAAMKAGLLLIGGTCAAAGAGRPAARSEPS